MNLTIQILILRNIILCAYENLLKQLKRATLDRLKTYVKNNLKNFDFIFY